MEIMTILLAEVFLNQFRVKIFLARGGQMTTQRLRIEMQTRLLRISEDRFETMLRVELGNLRTSIYLERSNFPPETDVRIMFWYDYRKSGISNGSKPDLTEISDDKRIFANDVMALLMFLRIYTLRERSTNSQ